MEMMLVNPRGKKRGRKRGRRSGPRRMTAKQARYFAPRRSGKRRRRSVAALAGPVVHRRRSRRMKHRSRHGRRHSGGGSMRRMSFNGFLNGTLMPSGIGALGAIGLDAALGYVSPHLPPSLQSGIAQSAVKLAGAVAVGYLASKVMGRRFGEQVTAGAVTVTLYGLIKPYIAQAIPGVSGYDLGWVSPAPTLSAYVGSDNSYSGGMGAYIDGGPLDESDRYAYGTQR